LSVAGVLAAAITASAPAPPPPTASALPTSLAAGTLAGLTGTRCLGTIAGSRIRPFAAATVAAAGIAARAVGTRRFGTGCVNARSVGTGSVGTTRLAAMFSSTVIAMVAILAARPAVTAGFAGSVARPSLARRLAPWLAVAISIAPTRPVPLAVTIGACVTMCGTLARRLRRCRS
jgi:hypothetical protein